MCREMLNISLSEHACSIREEIILFFFPPHEIQCDFSHLALKSVVLSFICVDPQMSSLLHITLRSAFRGQMNVWCLLQEEMRWEVPVFDYPRAQWKGQLDPWKGIERCMIKRIDCLGREKRRNKGKSRDLGTVLEEETHSLSQVVCHVGPPMPLYH